MAGILREIGGTPILVNGVEDHIHVLTHLQPKLSVSNVVRDLKANSSRWVHTTHPERSSFAWQRGYAGFTVSRSNADDVRAYIADQEAHHKKVSFQDEYRAFLRKHGIEFDERYAWD
jgi:putative transposase